LIVPTLRGPLFAVGEVEVSDAVKIEALANPGSPDREAALSAGSTVLGADEVLMKSAADPKGGEIYEAEPNRAYVVPAESVHKSNPILPTGRIFFQLDAVA
jgi:hypothetical protein